MNFSIVSIAAILISIWLISSSTISFAQSSRSRTMCLPRDEFGVAHVDLLFNKDANVCFCVLDAPDEEAVKKHHEKANVKCEWILQVETAKTLTLFFQ